MELFGVPVAKKEQQSEHCEVWEENYEAVSIFLDLTTQWNTEMGTFKSLNYQSLEVVMRLHSPKDPIAVLRKVQVMEMEALRALADGSE